MKKIQLLSAVAGAFASSFLLAPAASGQVANGSELRSASVQVQFDDGTVNTVTFNPDGTASIQGPMTTVPARWWVDSQQLCLEAVGSRECWPYQTAFQNGQMVTLTSSCGATSHWTPLSTAPTQQRRPGERG